MNINSLNNYIYSKTSPSPLVIFRIAFGLLIFFSILRFWSNGWIKSLYLDPIFHFSYLGFSWVKPVGNYTYLIFILCMLSSLGFALGYKYKLSSIVLFLSFTYIELMDKTTYLNHYYLISILSFMLIFLPAANYFSIDSLKLTSLLLVSNCNFCLVSSSLWKHSSLYPNRPLEPKAPW